MKLLDLKPNSVSNVRTPISVMWRDMTQGTTYLTEVVSQVDLFRTYDARQILSKPEESQQALAHWLLRAAIYEEARADPSLNIKDFITETGALDNVEVILATKVHDGAIMPVCVAVEFAA
ncbi:hypothetical protein HGG70_05205 [Rhodobacteraceae bacterium R_SAG4]|nr:hypothetical protein [Rhodobacteraceae bacterium R_SAG4]